MRKQKMWPRNPVKAKASANPSRGRPRAAQTRRGPTGRIGQQRRAPKPGDANAKGNAKDGTAPGNAKGQPTAGDKAAANDMVKKAADLVKKMSEQAKPGADGAVAKDLAGKMAEAAKGSCELTDAIKNADPKLVAELAEEPRRFAEANGSGQGRSADR